MKKILAILLSVMMILTIGACGKKEEQNNSGATADNQFTGEWIGVGGDLFGMAMTAEEAAAYTLTVNSDGKAVLTTDGEPLETTWESAGDTITLKVDVLDEESAGTLSDGAIQFEDLLGLGINIYFAKEGTDAADPSLYIPEADKAMIGTWKSYAVTDILDDDASAIIPADSLTITFNGDYTADIDIGELKITGESWTLYDGYGFLTDSDYDITWDVTGDEIVVSYYDGNDTYKFTCKKA